LILCVIVCLQTKSNELNATLRAELQTSREKLGRSQRSREELKRTLRENVLVHRQRDEEVGLQKGNTEALQEDSNSQREITSRLSSELQEALKKEFEH